MLIEPNQSSRNADHACGSQMPTLRFGLHRPGVSTEEKNTNSVDCEINVDNGVARLSMDMLGRDFNAEVTIGFDGTKVILILRDSEGNMENYHMYPKDEA